MKNLLYLLLVISISCCKGKKKSADDIASISTDYVRLGLFIGQYDPDFVDAYYGPDSLKPAGNVDTTAFPKDSLLNAANLLSERLSLFVNYTGDISKRAIWMKQQLRAFERRIRIFSKEYASFDTEARDLFGVVPSAHTEEYFKVLLSSLDSILPGQGSVADRYQSFAKRFVIPKEKIDTVFKTAIVEARKRTLERYSLPDSENFKMEYVTGKSWSGYNWYQGNYQSLIQISTDLDIYIERAIDLACHEGYPGHHVYNMLLEKNLYKDKGWVEISLYPLFSPQSLIAEGSANYGIDMAFPGTTDVDYTRDILLPAAGLDTNGISFYFKALALKSKLNYARNEVARELLEGRMNEEEAIRWLTTYNLFSREAAFKSISFIRKYRSYVINYNYGLDLVRKYIQQRSSTDEERWKSFEVLLSNPITTEELVK